MKSTITVKTKQGYVKKITAEFTPSDYLVVSKALILLSENKKVNEIDRQRARELHKMGLLRMNNMKRKVKENDSM